MVAQTHHALPRLAVPSDPVWRLSIEQYHEMIRIGILTDDDPVELLQGWLITKMPKNPPHRLSTQLSRDTIARMLPAGWHVQDQEPITVLDSEPEPDVAVIAGDLRQYRDRHPGASDVALVIEVSDATLQRDRTIKQQVYGRAGIAVYWIINLPEQQLEVYTLPLQSDEAATYGQCTLYKLDDRVELTISNQAIGSIVVSDLLP